MEILTKSDRLVIAGTELSSRLFLGTGKYPLTRTCWPRWRPPGAELVTVALRRLDLDDPAKKTILDVIDWNSYRILPNTLLAGRIPRAAHASASSPTSGISPRS